MKAEFIKPIPKYIREKIYELDLKERTHKPNCFRIPPNMPMFYSYLTKVKGELVKITVATVYYYRKWYCKQVYAHGVKSKMAWMRDIKYYAGLMGSGFKVGWSAEGCTRRVYRHWFEQDWVCTKFDGAYPYTTTVNPEFVEKFKEYRYSAYQQIGGDCIVAYLKLYEQYPQVEYLVKLGLRKLRHYKSILKRIAKNKSFCKWLIANKYDLASGTFKMPVINKAFKTGRTLEQAKRFIDSWKRLHDGHEFTELREMFRNEVEQFCNYLQKHDSDPSSYLDYINACKYLRLDMARQENRYPNDFKRWHDKRIDEFNTMKARADAKERKELYKQFSTVAEKYLTLQNCKQGAYAVLIARSPADLIREGEQLKHCVGKMNYEQKMVKEETLIFFIRPIERMDVPFVTIEYSLTSKKVLQCYGYQSQKPDDEVITFVNKIWLPYANRTIKKICA